MHLKEREITDTKEINEIFKNSDVCRIALIDGDMPYIIPMNFGYLEEKNSIYFHCAVEGRKIDLIKKNPNACFQLDTSHELIISDIACKCTMKYKSIIGTGTISIVEDEKDRIDGLNVIMKQYSGKDDFTFNTGVMKKTCILRLKIKEKKGKQSI